MTREIPLTRGMVALVDDADYAFLSKWTWYASPQRGGSFAAVSRTFGRPDKMHRVVMDAPKGMDVDHIDGNPLNNTRTNLRVCTRAQNLANQGPRKRNRSGFKGVSVLSARPGYWRAGINVDGKKVWLGDFPCKVAAARAYDNAARHHHGEFARLNFPADAVAA